MDADRGPDVLHRINVPAEWLVAGVTLEVELPRHLTCARCEGGGCDACERSGALTLRGKEEPPELVTVRLPAQSPGDAESRTADLVLRIPEAGGFPPADRDWVRGHLLLRVTRAESASPGVSRARQAGARVGLEERRQLMQRSAIVAVSLSVVFVLILWLSGWL